LDARVAQCNISRTDQRGTVRGLHYQAPPARETKLVRCIRGALHDVIVDLRPASPTYGRHIALVLSADDGKALYVPALVAHGFQTLLDDTEVLYQMGEFYEPELQGGLRHDDPELAIEWPLPVTAISDRDRTWPLLERKTLARQEELSR
jgi:dTDP-4-dehydrorhamnose 3,5-epimerase